MPQKSKGLVSITEAEPPKEEPPKINLRDEETSMRSLLESRGLKNAHYLVHGNRLVLLLGSSPVPPEQVLKDNYSILSFMLEHPDREVYLDFGCNRQKLTKSLLNHVNSR